MNNIDMMCRLYAFCASVSLVLSCSSGNVRVSDDCPPVWPDYAGVTVPVNIAPLDFGIEPESGYSRMQVSVLDSAGNIVLTSKGECTCFGLKRWHKILAANAGSFLELRILMKNGEGWTRFAPLRMNVSRDSIDYGLTYRRIFPGYQSFGYMGIYERRLYDFNERMLVDSRMLDAGCVNCHTQNRTDPQQYSLHVRGAHSATMLARADDTEYLDTKTDSTGGFFVYPYWHPSGDYIAYSVNTTRQSFYAACDKKIEVYDEASDVIVYCPDSKEILRPSILNSTASLETKPAFSADGRTLYFCTAPAGKMPDEIENTKYSLCAIAFNPGDGTFGDRVDTLVPAASTGLSFASPRPSYDGKYILLTASSFGTFMIWHKEADLWIYNIADGSLYPAGGINSPDTDSFHNWSSNSKWAVVATRGEDGLHTMLHIAHIEEDGTFSKSFLLPQRNPVHYYRSLPDSYNTPDFTSGPSPVDARKMRRGVMSGRRARVRLRDE
ncbi:MAG: TolB family protein [Candidatus Cryptobacteroides sp.]